MMSWIVVPPVEGVLHLASLFLYVFFFFFTASTHTSRLVNVNRHVAGIILEIKLSEGSMYCLFSG